MKGLSSGISKKLGEQLVETLEFWWQPGFLSCNAQNQRFPQGPITKVGIAFESAAGRGQGGDGWVRAVGGSGDILSK